MCPEGGEGKGTETKVDCAGPHVVNMLMLCFSFGARFRDIRSHSIASLGS